MDHLTNDDYDKIIDLELKKKALQKEHGMVFPATPSILPVEVESTWLDYISNFEKQHKHAKKVSIYIFIGEPEYRKVSKLSPSEIKEELHELLAILKKNNIVLDALCDVDDHEMYRFITEELFYQEIDNMRMEGMMSCFTYEDFHPNAQYDIQQACEHFFTMTLGKVKDQVEDVYDLLYVDTDAYVSIEGKPVKKKKVEKSIFAFLNTFDRFEISSLDIDSIKINDEKTYALVDFRIDYKGLFDGSSFSSHYKGPGRLVLKSSPYSGWDICTVDMPGLVI